MSRCDRDGKLTVDYNTDSDSAAESGPEEDDERADDERVGSDDVEMFGGATAPVDSWNGLVGSNSARADLILRLAAGRLTSVGIDDTERRVRRRMGVVLG